MTQSSRQIIIVETTATDVEYLTRCKQSQFASFAFRYYITFYESPYIVYWRNENCETIEICSR